MSKTILEDPPLYVNAMVGGGGAAWVQITITGTSGYVQLDEEATRKLIDVLQKRLAREPGYRATD